MVNRGISNQGKADTASFWRDKSVLLTGATGLVGGWLTKRLIKYGANSVCLIRDWVPQSEFVRTGQLEGVNVVRGDLNERDLIERALGEYEVQIVFHLAAQTIVGIANSNPVSTFESNIRGTWNLLESCRRSPHDYRLTLAASKRHVREAQSMKRSTMKAASISGRPISRPTRAHSRLVISRRLAAMIFGMLPGMSIPPLINSASIRERC